MSKLFDTITEYHAQGFAVIPLVNRHVPAFDAGCVISAEGKLELCNCAKSPLLKSWQHVTHQEKIDQSIFKGSISAGWVVDKNYLIVDVDNHEADGNKIGSNSLKEMSKHYGFDFFANAGVIVTTASGGWHLYYKLPEKYVGSKFRNKFLEFKCVEFKGFGRQVVIPNSVLVDGRKYKKHVLSGGFENITYLPDAILNDLVKADRAEDASDSVLISSDSNADIASYQEFLDSQPELLAGARNNTFYHLACEGKDSGLTRKTVLGMLLAYNQEKVRPLLERSEISHCVNSAFKYSKNKTAVRSVAADFLGESPAESALKDLDKTLSEVEAKIQFDGVIEWRDSLIKSAKGVVSRTNFGTKNTEIYLDNLPNLRDKLAVNLFSMDTIWRRPAPWHKPTILTGEIDKVLDDDDLIRMREALNQVGFDPTTSHVLEASRAVSLRNEYHPVKEYFEKLPVWDKVHRLAGFFPELCGAEDCAYSQQLGVKIFTAIVARIYNPGCKFDYLPIFIGEQGIGKSTLLEAIAIKPQWYTDNLGAIDNKDVILRMRSKLIVENAELTMFDKNDPNTVKAFLSRRVDRDRLPYDRLPRDLPRQCIIFATTNKDRFLQDETGNRRMWPIELTKINLPGVKKILPLLYAEAIARFKAGEALYLDTKDANDIATAKQEERYNSDDWEPKVEEWIDTNNHKKLTIGMVWEGCFLSNITYCGFREQKRIGSVLRRLGWVRASVQIDGKIHSGFKK